MIWALNMLLIGLIAGYLIAEKLVGIEVILEHTVFRGQPSTHVINVHVQATGGRAWARA